MRVLNVAEKPSMARQITLLLSNDDFDSVNGKNKYCKNYIFKYQFMGNLATMVMTSVLGHVKEVDFPEEYGDWYKIPFEELFVAPVISKISDKMKDVAENLRIESKKSTILIIWTDCDREGEYIGSEIFQICQQSNPKIDVYRARYSVLNSNELRRSMLNLSRLDTRQVSAAELRSELDLRAGAAFTRLQTVQFKSLSQDQTINSELKGKVISYGTCQFPTLGFVVEQYFRVLNFKAENFWYIQMEISQQGKLTKFTWQRNRIFDKQICSIIYEKCMETPIAKITKIESKPTLKWRPLPLRTVELQKLGAKFLKMSSDKIMEISEKLYNQGYISYPRTETDMFENNFDLQSLIRKQVDNPKWGGFAQSLINGKFKFPRRGKNNDKAHPPIHPTKDGSSLSGAELKVYEFIVRRFLGCCSEDAKGLETIVLARVGNEQFRSRGIIVQELNYLEVYIYENWNDQIIGQFIENEEYSPSKLELSFGVTSPPKLLTESELIGSMDKNGIGTDATIHEHIKKIIERQYVIKTTKDSRFHPTNLGVSLVTGYDQVGLEESLTKPKLRAILESDLKDICDGRRSKFEVLEKLKSLFKEALICVKSKMNILLDSIGKNAHLGLFSPAPLEGNQSTLPPIPRTNRRINDDGGGGGNNNNFDDSDEDDSRRNRSSSRSVKREGNENLDGPNCQCGKKTTKLTTKKPGPNCGREFWSCKNCKYFCWVGEEENLTSNNFKQNIQGNCDIFCHCGKVAVSRTVSKDGPNHGKSFFACAQPKESSCQFFQWSIDERDEQQSHSLRRPVSKFDHCISCSCGLLAVRDTTRGGVNAGKVYYRCSKTIKKCGFFQWEEENTNNPAKPINPINAINTTNSGNFSISCYKCGQPGHFSNSCQNQENINYNNSDDGRQFKRAKFSGRGRGKSRGSSSFKRSNAKDG